MILQWIRLPRLFHHQEDKNLASRMKTVARSFVTYEKSVRYAHSPLSPHKKVQKVWPSPPAFQLWQFRTKSKGNKSSSGRRQVTGNKWSGQEFLPDSRQMYTCSKKMIRILP
jgi:hypothetical protein